MNEPFICFEKTYRGAGMSKISWWGQALCYGRKLPPPPLIVIEYRVNTGTYMPNQKVVRNSPHIPIRSGAFDIT